MAVPRAPRQLNDEEWNNIISVNFPHVARADVQWIGPADGLYNCIAWSIGDTHDYYGTEDFPTLQDCIDWYERHGYERCNAAQAEVDGWAKNGTTTHASRYYNDTLGWTSKLGPNILITHPRNGLVGPAYGEIVVHFRRALDTGASSSRSSGVVVEGSDEAFDQVTRLAGQQASTFGALKQKFESFWGAWKAHWFGNVSSSLSFYASGKEWDDLVNMGTAILPFVVEKLKDPKNAIGCSLYEALQTSTGAQLTEQDKVRYGSAQQRGKRMAVLYATQLQVFEDLVKEWKTQQEQSAISSRISDFTHRCPAFNSIVAMGHPVIPAIMNHYAHDVGGWWYEALQMIVHGEASPTGGIDKTALHKQWMQWFDKGDGVAAAPGRSAATAA